MVAASVPGLIAVTVLFPVLAEGMSIAGRASSGEDLALHGLGITTAYLSIPLTLGVLVFGPIAVSLVAGVWAETQDQLGTRRAIDAIALLVALMVASLLFLPVCLLVPSAALALAVLATYSLCAALITRIALRLTWRAVDSWALASRR